MYFEISVYGIHKGLVGIIYACILYVWLVYIKRSEIDGRKANLGKKSGKKWKAQKKWEVEEDARILK